jgi:hypothetical protein
LAVNTFISFFGGKVTLRLYSGHHIFRVAITDSIQWLSGDDIQVPRLRIHGGRRAFCDLDYFFYDLSWHGFILITPHAAPRLY